MKNKHTILYVEDDEITRENAIEYLNEKFETILEAKDAFEALSLYEKYHPSIIITDIQMPKLNGLEFVQKIRQRDDRTQVIIISAYSSKEYLLKAIELQLVKYLIKPVEQIKLDEALAQCLEKLCHGTSNIIHLNQDSYFDDYNDTLVFNNEVVKLRLKELKLLKLLCKYSNRYVKYEEIESYVWQDSAMSKDALKTLVKHLKNKTDKHLIQNLSNVGYKLELQ